MLRKLGLIAAGMAAAVTLVLSGCGGAKPPATGRTPASGAPGQNPAAEPSPGALVIESNQPQGQPQGMPPKPPEVDRAQVLKYAQCMRDNGVKNFPDPGPGGALQMDGSTVNLNSPEFQQAQQKCGHLMPAAPTMVATR